MLSKTSVSSLTQIVVFIGGWIACFWGPFQYFLRTRFYLVGATQFDLIFFIICLISAFALIISLRNRPFIAFFGGCIGVGIWAYVSLFLMPVMDFSNLSNTITLFAGITSQKGHIPFSLLIGNAFVGLGGFLQMHAYEGAVVPEGGRRETHWIFRLLVPVCASLILYWILMYIFPQNSHLPLELICVASAFVIILGIIRFRQLQTTELYSTIIRINNQPDLQAKTTILRTFAMIIAWFSYSAIIIVDLLLYFHLVQAPSELVLAQNFIISAIIGALILIIVIAILKKELLFQIFLPIVSCILLLSQYNLSVNQKPIPLLNGALGCTAIFITFNYLYLITKYAKGKVVGIRGLGTFGVLFTWLIAAYIAFVPIKADQFISFQAWLIPILWLMSFSFIVCSLVLYFFIPTFQMTFDSFQNSQRRAEE